MLMSHNCQYQSLVIVSFSFTSHFGRLKLVCSAEMQEASTQATTSTSSSDKPRLFACLVLIYWPSPIRLWFALSPSHRSPVLSDEPLHEFLFVVDYFDRFQTAAMWSLDTRDDLLDCLRMFLSLLPNCHIQSTFKSTFTLLFLLANIVSKV